ncbi:MAG: hypothetical protein WDN69_11295 [Aliidongia sp.]
MSTTTLKTVQRAVFASLLLVAVAACSGTLPQPQLAAADLAAQNAIAQGGN